MKNYLYILLFAISTVSYSQGIIHHYPNKTTIDPDDKLLGTDASDLSTKNFTINSLESYFLENFGSSYANNIEVSKTSAMDIALAVNLLPQFLVNDNTLTFFDVTLTDTDPIVKEVYVLKAGSGVYGYGGQQLISSDLYLVSTTIPSSSANPTLDNRFITIVHVNGTTGTILYQSGEYPETITFSRLNTGFYNIAISNPTDYETYIFITPNGSSPIFVSIISSFMGAGNNNMYIRDINGDLVDSNLYLTLMSLRK